MKTPSPEANECLKPCGRLSTRPWTEKGAWASTPSSGRMVNLLSWKLISTPPARLKWEIVNNVGQTPIKGLAAGIAIFRRSVL